MSKEDLTEENACWKLWLNDRIPMPAIDLSESILLLSITMCSESGPACRGMFRGMKS